jgi:hypothetical protein
MYPKYSSYPLSWTEEKSLLLNKYKLFMKTYMIKVSGGNTTKSNKLMDTKTNYIRMFRFYAVSMQASATKLS